MPLKLFKSGVYSVGVTVGFLIGFIMFGSVIYIPLFLQVVYRATPTQSGLEMLPMVFALLFTYITSGRLVARWGRYKIFPVVGHRDHGAGLDPALDDGHLDAHRGGVAVHGHLGLRDGHGRPDPGPRRAERGAPRAARDGDLGSDLLPIRRRRVRSGALRLDLALESDQRPAPLPHLGGDQAGQHQGAHHEPCGDRQARAPAVHAGVVHAYSAALGTVFLVAAPFGVAAFILSLFLKEVPLRDRDMSLESASTADIF